MDELKVGDVVVLKAGGPSMTIYQINGNDVGCKWFDGNELKHGGFVTQELELDE
ncbi:DUF2158 domain-containing protein [Aureitalea sp. L0-47]|uniref:DUF2158 domain-containing protein n=1 Tax=Aureitalea sp. L0-47 TaxID=2816962 RepID=UPI002237B9F7|nr:DUF2158 domain-containing protein [Aureitalea sp. L0-47]MCW5519407.1 DUF2158 domain-containing protein [Aureitalea sp. L0-47]